VWLNREVAVGSLYPPHWRSLVNDIRKLLSTAMTTKMLKQAVAEHQVKSAEAAAACIGSYQTDPRFVRLFGVIKVH
jgi:hypothetical protein